MIQKEALERVFGTRVFDKNENWRLSCPFHDESTGSFLVHKEDYVAYCFGCGVGGSIDVLASRFRGYSRQDAWKSLGLRAEDFLTPRKKRVEAPTRVFPESWLAPWKRLERCGYLESRGFDSDVYQQFDTRWDGPSRRVVFPMRRPRSDGSTNKTCTLVGAVGRSITSSYPKYLYYWDCQKSRNIFTGPEVLRDERVIIVEGVLDLLWLYQHGFKKSCAILGALPSASQLAQIRDLTDEVVIALDNDDAGRKGTEKLFQALKKSCNVWFINWPNSDVKDVCDLKADELTKAIGDALSPFERKRSWRSAPKVSTTE